MGYAKQTLDPVVLEQLFTIQKDILTLLSDQLQNMALFSWEN